MKKTFNEKVAYKLKRIYYATAHLDFVKTYHKRFSSDFSQKDLECCVSNLYEFRFGKKLDLNDVKTFNQKLNWMKCFYHDDRMTECADKATAPTYFKTHTGLDDSFVVKNLGIYDASEEIDFETLPKEFVLKSNWGSGRQIIVKDKKQININQIKKTIKLWNDFKTNHYYHGFEYGYKNIIPKIVCEEFVKFEYKIEFFCFDGNPHYFWTVYNDKTNDVCANFYNAITLEKLNLKQGYPNAPYTISIPKEYKAMFDIASTLSKEFPFVRIDFFKTSASFKFSEMTFYHWCGFMPFEPASYDLEFGEKIQLPEKII